MNHPLLHRAPAARAEARPAPDLAAAGLGAGSPVYTREGAIPVEFLLPGDAVVTRGAGCRTLIAVELAEVAAGPLVRLHAGALGPDRPSEDLLLAPGQLLLLRGALAEALAGRPQALLPAAALAAAGVAALEPAAGPRRLHRLRFAEAQVIYAAGAELLAPALHPAAG